MNTIEVGTEVTISYKVMEDGTLGISTKAIKKFSRDQLLLAHWIVDHLGKIEKVTGVTTDNQPVELIALKDE